MLRAMIFLAKGDIDELRRVIEWSRNHSAAALREAEGVGGGERVFDFARTFGELGLLGD
jgi:hypothetical protein